MIQKTSVPAAGQPLSFFNGPVFTGDGRILEGALVEVKDGLITRVEAGGEPPKGSLAMDLDGRALLPGFIDCHVHLCFDSRPDINQLKELSPAELAFTAARSARATLMAGVTTVRDMGGIGLVDIALARAVEEGLVPGPRILPSGRMICITGGHGWLFGARQADGQAEVVKAVREQVRAGCAQVKLMATGGVLTKGGVPGMAQFTREELAAAVKEAARLGRRCGAHAQGRQGIYNALKAGVSTIEHGHELDDEIMAMMEKQGAFYAPTLSAPVRTLEGGVEGGIFAEAVEKTRTSMKNQFCSAREAIARGLQVVMGTDAGIPFNRHGENLAELALLAEVGMSPEKALVSATGLAAKALGLENVTGRIEPGLAADLVVAKNRVLNDVTCLKEMGMIEIVVKGGETVLCRECGNGELVGG